MSKLKTIDNNKISLRNNKSEAYCKQWEEDILFEFGHITNQKGYSLKDLFELNDKKALKAYFELLEAISKSTWVELQKRAKDTKGGFEMLRYDCFCKNIADVYNRNMSKDTGLLIFRFGNADKYRMIGYKSHNCNRTLHVLGFDLDFTLYDHG